VGVIWLLVDQNRALQEQLAGATPTAAAPSLQTGEVLRDVMVESIEGGVQSIHELLGGKATTLLTVFHTTCAYCSANLPNWKALKRAASDHGTQFIGLSLHPKAATQRYVADNQIEWPVWTLTRSNDIARLKTPSIPVTVLTDDDGTIFGVWRGVLNSESIAAIVDRTSALAVRLDR
jgi:peroxiredoxin